MKENRKWKRWLSFFLSIVIFFTSIIPCEVADAANYSFTISFFLSEDNIKTDSGSNTSTTVVIEIGAPSGWTVAGYVVGSSDTLMPSTCVDFSTDSHIYQVIQQPLSVSCKDALGNISNSVTVYKSARYGKISYSGMAGPREYTGWRSVGWTTGTSADAETTTAYTSNDVYYGKYSKTLKAAFSMGKDNKNNTYAGTTAKPADKTATAYVNSYNLSSVCGNQVTLPDAPSWENHEFLGWSDGSAAYPAGMEVALEGDTEFTAQWELKTNVVTLDSQGATSNGSVSVEAFIGKEMPSITLPKKEFTVTFDKNTTDTSAVLGSTSLTDKYVFHGYYTGTDGSGTKYYHADGSSAKDWDGTGDTTLYASWTDQGVTLPEASRKGYTFQGWAASATAGSGAAAGETYKTDNDITLYAIWGRDDYTISYTLNGGTVADGNPSTYNVETAAFTLNNPTRTGYDFAGWTGSNGTTKQTSVSIAKGSTGNKTYTANWTARTDTAYKVKHYLMDLDGQNYTLKETENKTGTSDAELTLSSLKKEYTGFTYKEGKVDSSVVTKTTIAADGSREILLYYTRNQHTVSLTKSTGVASVSGNGTYYYGADVTVKAEMAAGYRFKNWTGSATSSSAEYTFTLGDSDVSYTANSSVITYTVGYTLNGGTVADGNPSTYNVETATFTLNNPTRTGYDFAGWTGSNGTTKQTSVSIAKGSTGNKTYTANWTARTDTAYKVKHYLMDLDGQNYTLKETENKTGTSDAELTLSSLKKEYTGFTYKEGKAGSSVVTKTTIAADGSREISLYYARNQYQFTLGALSHVKAEGTSAAGTYFFGAAITLKAQPDEGYEWVTWEGTGESDKTEKDTGFSMPTSHVTMTPKVAAKNYSIAYALGGGTNAAWNPSGYTVESADITLADPARTGYDFLGWTGSNGTAAQKGVMIPKGSTGNKSYTANWKVITYDISYLMNKGTNSSTNPASYTVESADITLEEPVRAGYDFAGWTGSSGETPQKSVEIPKGSTGNKSYTANWTARTDTPYQIVIHRESLEGDYSDTAADVIVSKKGTTDTKVAAASIAASYQYEGFTYSHARAQDSAAGGAEAAEMNIDGEGDAVLHLYYSRNAYELTIGDYDESKVATENTDTTLLYGEKIKLRATALSGYKFSRWDSSDTGIQPDVKTSSATLTMAASDLTMTPLAADTVYTIDFKANDTDSHTPENNVRAISVPDDQEYSYSEAVTMPGCTRTGFTFLGWSKARNGAVQYTAGQRVSGLSSTDKDIVKLYAVWEEHTYSIAFHANDASNTAANPAGNVVASGLVSTIGNIYYTDNVPLPRNGYTRKGFTFRGWSKSAGKDNAADFLAGDCAHGLTEMDNGTVTLYAAWTEKSYLVHFEPADAYCYGSSKGEEAHVIDASVMDNRRVSYTQGCQLPDVGYSRTGFTFVGWTTDKTKAQQETYHNPDYAGEYGVGAEVDLELLADTTFYPVWKENKYTIVYHDNGTSENPVSGTVAGQQVYYTESFQAAGAGLTRTGFSLAGWSASSGSNAVVYAKGATYCKQTVNGVLNIYAVWNEHSYTVSFEPNDSVSYAAMNGDDAVITPVTNPGAVAEMKINYTQTANFPACTYHREGFTFKGWTTDPEASLGTYEGTETGYGAGTKIPALSKDGARVTYYPIWQENRYTVRYDSNDTDTFPAGGSISDMEVYYTQSFRLPGKGFTRAGHHMKGWSMAESSSHVNHPVNGRQMVKGNMNYVKNGILTYYAAWKEHSYTVSFEPDDEKVYETGEVAKVTDSGAMPDMTLDYTENTVYPECNYERPGFTFLGWTENKGESVNTYREDYDSSRLIQPGTKLQALLTEEGDRIVYYPVWSENRYQIVFDPNDENNAHTPVNEPDAEGSMAVMKDIYYTQKVSLRANRFTRTGFRFLDGWSDTKSDNNVKYTEKGTYKRLSDRDQDTVTMYAAWSEKEYTVQFDPADRVCHDPEENGNVRVTNPESMGSITVKYTEDFLVQTEYERTGFTFLGYSTRDDNAEVYNEEYFVPYGENTRLHGLVSENGGEITLYTIWSENRYGIHFHGNDTNNASTPANETKAAGITEDMDGIYYTDRIHLTLNGFERKGFTWSGWSDTKCENDIDRKDGEACRYLTAVDGDVIHLYAAWQENSYLISYVPNDEICHGTEYGVECPVSNPSAMVSKKVYFTDNYTVSENLYQREGFTFQGYCLTPSISGMENSSTASNSLEKKSESMLSNLPAFVSPGNLRLDVAKENGALVVPGDILHSLSSDRDGEIILYPVWKEHTYDIVFYANDKGVEDDTKAMGSTGSMRVFYSDKFHLNKNGFQRAGYDFLGWSETAGGTEKYKDEAEGNKLVSDSGGVLELYAVWKENYYTIAFAPNDGYSFGEEERVSNPASMAGIQISHTKRQELPENQYVREGFLFRGWTCKREDSRKLYPESDTYDPDYRAPYQPGDVVSGMEQQDGDVITLYPVWEEISYAVNFHSNDCGNAHTPENGSKAEGSMEDIAKVYYTEEFTLPKNTYTRTGFTWKGWGIKEKGNDVVYTDRQRLSRMTEKNGKEIDLYAAWSEARYSISYNANGSYCYGAKDGVCAGVDKENAMKDSTVTLYYTDLYEIPSCGYRRDGFSFLGWTGNSNDIKKLYPEDKEYDKDFHASWQPGDVVSGLSAEDGGTVILYPLWKEHKMSIVFDKNADDAVWQADGKSKNVYYTEAWSVNHTPERTGYQFSGYAWNRDAEHADFMELSDRKKLLKEDGAEAVLYALWKADELTITYESEGVVSSYSQTAVYGEETVLADEKAAGFADTGKTFLGWSTQKQDSWGTVSDVDYEAGSTSSICFGLADKEVAKSLHLYAVWRENLYGVEFITDGEPAEVWKNVKYTEELRLPASELEGFTFQGWSYTKDAGTADYKAGDLVSRLPRVNADGAEVTLYAVYSMNPPVIDSQVAAGDFPEEVKPHTEIALSVSASGVELEYQWYRKDVSGVSAPITGADKDHYTIPSADMVEENDGSSYYCVVANEVGSITSKEVTIHIFGIPAAPQMKTNVQMNSSGWVNKDITATFIGSTIKGGTDQVAYQYCFDGESFQDAEKLCWTDNTAPEGQMVFIRAYNKDCPELVSAVTTCFLRKDSEVPKIAGVKSMVSSSAIVTGGVVTTGTSAVMGGNISVNDSDFGPSAVTTSSSLEIITDASIAVITDSYPVAATGGTVETATGGTVEAATETLDTDGMGSGDNSDVEYAGIMPKFRLLSMAAGAEEPVATEVPPVKLSAFTGWETCQITIEARDAFSGIGGYAVAPFGEKPETWQTGSVFELKAGRYTAYVRDRADNVGHYHFSLYPNGMVLPDGENGSYADNGELHVVGNGEAGWGASDIRKDDVTHIVIEDGITFIPDGFFDGFGNLEEITVPGSVVGTGGHVFDHLPEHVVIHAPEGSFGEQAAEEHHFTEYELIIGTGAGITVHWRDEVKLPETESSVPGKTQAGWGTNGEKQFAPGEIVSGLTNDMNGSVILEPIYTDAYIDEDGRLHITGDNTKYLDDILQDKNKVTEIIIEEGVTVLPEQIPDGFKNLTDLTLPESIKEIPDGRLDGMTDSSVIHAPEGSVAAEEAGKNHRIEYEIQIDGMEEEFHVHYQDKITLPETAPEKEGYVFIGWGTTPDNKEFEPGQTVSGLTGTPDGKVTLYPIYDKEKAETPEETKDSEIPEEPEGNSGTGNGGSGSGNYLPSIPGTLPGSGREDTEDAAGQKDGDKMEQDVDKTEQTGQENGVLHAAQDGNDDKFLPEAALENQGVIDGSIYDRTKKENKGRIIMKIKLPSIVIERGSTCVVKPVKGVTSWTVRNKKIAGLKKKDGKLILTGKKNGQTVLIGKKNGKPYRYVIRVKKKKYNHQVKLAVVGKEKSGKSILMKSGAVVKEVAVKDADGKITLKLLWAGKDVKWKLFGDGILKKKGTKAVVRMDNDSCIITAKYKGKTYRCELYR